MWFKILPRIDVWAHAYASPEWPLCTSIGSLMRAREKGLPIIHISGLEWKEIGEPLEFIDTMCQRV